ncbi:MAG TPA: type II toxin-antitoxin system VapC family toxin [Thermoanaerobaculia bacterium]|nr:type II toxin-antitoxin system VapC family toxin [Thermoanaerobaculia bacterium]
MAARGLLLDTHVWLWMNGEPERLRADVRERLVRADEDLFLSAASAWEIGIKVALGKLSLPEPPERYLPSRLTRHQVSSLAVQQIHGLQAAALPGHHRDPFDRLLVAQAQVDRLTLVTADGQLGSYDVELLWAGA